MLDMTRFLLRFAVYPGGMFLKHCSRKGALCGVATDFETVALSGLPARISRRA